MNNETYVYYDVYNHTNQLGVESFALPFCKFKFVPNVGALEANGILSNTKVLWLFGDGSTSQSLTGSHAYTEPGEYQVQSYFYDELGNAYTNTFSRTVIVKNYVEDNIDIRISTGEVTDGMVLSAGRITSPIIVTRTNSYQTYHPGKQYSIIPYASGGNISTSYFDGVSSLLYSHLERYHAFYTRETNRAGAIEFVEQSELIIPSTLLYCKLGNTGVQMTTASDAEAVFCGTSGSKITYFKDDVASDPINLFFGFGKSIFGVNTTTVGLSCSITPNTDYRTLSITSNGIDGEGAVLDTFQLTNNKFTGAKTAFVAKIKDNNWYTIKNAPILSSYGVLVDNDTGNILDADVIIENHNITTVIQATPQIYSWSPFVSGTSEMFLNSMDASVFWELSAQSGDITGVFSSFSIPPDITYTANEIATLVYDSISGFIDSSYTLEVVGDSIIFTRSLPGAGYAPLTALCVGRGDWSVPVSAYEVQPGTDGYSYDSASYVKGYVISREPTANATLQIYTSILGGYYLSGSSSTFTILDSNNTYKVAKQGEYFDMTESYKELGFQDLFNDKDVLFNDFLGSIVGNLSSAPTSIGKSVYEKITNFVDNNSNIEKCNVAQLVSLLESIGDENILFEKSNFNFPAALKRLVDILSIKHSALFGSVNTFDQDFYNFGNSQEYQGKNLGAKLDTLSYTVSAGTPIVALEKYSSTFKKLDTYYPLSAVSIQQQLSSHPTQLTYPLSTYSNDWGWGLVLNDDYQATDLPKYYNFFEYIPNAVSKYSNNVINFEDFNNTIPMTLSSYSAWANENGIIDVIVANQLYTGLDLL